MVLRNHLVEQRLPLRKDRRNAVLSLDLPMQVPAQPAPQDWIGHYGLEGSGDSTRILVRHEEARFAFDDLLCGAVIAGRDHGQPGRASLVDHVWHALAAREPDEH